MTVPLPLPLLDVVSQLALLEAVQVQPDEVVTVNEPEACKAGDVLTGRLKPTQCPSFGTRCTPEQPLGAPMVSTEGACAAYYSLMKHRAANAAPVAS